MRYLLPLAVVCFFSAFQPLCAQSSTDPGDLFVNAYMAVQQAEKAEQSGDFGTALTKLRSAASVLDTIAKKFPTWQPPIVAYRKQRTVEALARVQERVGKVGPGKGTPDEEGKTPTLIPDSEIFAPPTEIGPEPATPRPRKSSVPRAPEIDSTTGLEEAIGRMKKLQADLKEANAAADRAEREKKDLVQKVDDAIQAREKAEKEQKKLQDRADNAEERLLKAQSELKLDAEKIKALQAEAGEARKVVRAAKLGEDVEEEMRRQTADRLKAAQLRSATLTEQSSTLAKANKDAPMKIKDLEQQLDKARAENTDLAAKLTETKTQLATMTGQRDEAMKQLAQLKEAAKNVDKLVSDNAALMAKLAETQKAVANFQAEGEEKDQQIAALKKEVGTVKVQLAQARLESADYQKQMGDLQGRLEAQGRQLAQVRAENVASTAEKKKMMVENDILRGIVLRQQKQEAQRAATKKLVLGELAKLEINSKTLLKEIEFLSQPIVKLTAREMELFKKPSLQVTGNEISANLPKVEEPPPAAVIDPAAKEPPMIEPKTPEIAVAPTDVPPAKIPDTDLALNKPVVPPISIPEPPAPGLEEKPAPSETLGSVAGQPNIPAKFLPLARDGKELFEKGDYRGAEKIYEKILAEVPNNLYILSNLGVVRFRAGKLKQAEEALLKATKVAPEDGFSHCTLGIVYYTGQKLDEAVSSLTKALAINPKNATAHNYLGITAASKGWQEAAQKELETATTLDPAYADAHFNLAVVFATQTPPNKDNARKFYKRATELGAETDSDLEKMLK